VPRAGFGTAAAQRQQFGAELSGSLVRRYAIVTMDDGTRVPLNYEMRPTEHRWKIYDVTIEGRSYLFYWTSDLSLQQTSGQRTQGVGHQL